jgi:hypothetical protein
MYCDFRHICTFYWIIVFLRLLCHSIETNKIPVIWRKKYNLNYRLQQEQINRQTTEICLTEIEIEHNIVPVFLFVLKLIFSEKQRNYFVSNFVHIQLFPSVQMSRPIGGTMTKVSLMNRLVSVTNQTTSTLFPDNNNRLWNVV